MRKPNALIFVAWALHLAAWFLPVVKANDVHPFFPGWKAFRYAACGVWPCEGIKFQTLHHAVLATISVLTTLFFIFCSLWFVLRGSGSLRRPFAWAAAAAFAFNTHWIVIFGSDRSALTIGYFLWLSSFLFLALGLFLSRDEGEKEAPSTVAHTA
jgi:hypothetical protein